MKAFIFLGLLISCASCPAQVNKAKSDQPSKPNLSGTWELDRVWSTVDNRATIGGVVVLTITQTESRVLIILKANSLGKETTKNFSYFPDGKGESNLVPIPVVDSNNKVISPVRVHSTTRWKGDKLKIQYSFNVQLPEGGKAKIDIEEEWQIQPGGKTLVHTRKSSSNESSFEIEFKHKRKNVYNRTS